MRFLLPLALIALAAAAPAAKPAPKSSALKGHDTHAPIDIDSDRVDVHDRDNQAIFSGKVHAVQGDMTLDSATLKVFYEKKENSDPEIQRIDAQGDVKMTSPSETAKGNYGVYDVAQRTITLIGNVTLNQGDNVLHGQRLAIDLDSGRSTLDASSSSTPGKPGRVTGRFVVPQKSNSDAPTTPAKP